MTTSRDMRARLTTAELHSLWTAWQAGQSETEIAAALARPLSSIHSAIRRRGGIAPPVRTRSPHVLRLAEREEISRGLAAGMTATAIAHHLGRAPSTITREIQRHGGAAAYRAETADRAAWARACRPKPCRLASQGRLRRVVARCLEQRWSPQQIAGWLMREYPTDPTMRISHETIYKTLYVQTRGALKRELLAALRRQRPMRQNRQAAATRRTRGRIPDAIPISERPPSVEDRAVPGHWEGDLIAGTKNSHIATLVERASRYVHLVKVEGKDTASVLAALMREAPRVPGGLMTSLTWDRGMEMAQHQLFSVVTDVQVFFCDPHSPWQRGSNENTNGLLRQYFPRGTDLRPFTQRDLDAVARELNTRPRATLGFNTPAAVLATYVASTG